LFQLHHVADFRQDSFMQTSIQAPDAVRSAIGIVIQSLATIPDDDWAAFERSLGRLHVKTGNYVFQIGEGVDKIYFVDSGLLRTYYLDQNGKEINRGFVVENEFVTSIMSFYANAPSNYGVQALEDTSLLFFTKAMIESMYERHESWERLGRLMAERNLIDKEVKEERFRKLLPVEHYRMIMRARPDWLERVPLYQLAAYIGVTPETLSRFRSADINKR
jgi:CRP-like cAMP-binding protein